MNHVVTQPQLRIMVEKAMVDTELLMSYGSDLKDPTKDLETAMKLFKDSGLILQSRDEDGMYRCEGACDGEWWDGYHSELPIAICIAWLEKHLGQRVDLVLDPGVEELQRLRLNRD